MTTNVWITDTQRRQSQEIALKRLMKWLDKSNIGRRHTLLRMWNDVYGKSAEEASAILGPPLTD